MRIVAISCVRNEADIIEPFVRHTLSFCERMIIMNHGSTDATAGILEQLLGEGLPLHLVHDATLGHVAAAHLDRLLQMAAHDYAADWILPLDADEFICGSGDASFLPPHVEGKTPCVKLLMRTYYAKSGDDPTVLNPVERMTRRLIGEPNPIMKVMVPGYLARETGSRLDNGNHRLILGAREAMFDILKGVWLAHFSLRTPAQYGLKIASKHLQRLRAFTPHCPEALYYRDAYNQLKRSYSEFAKSFETQPLAYFPPHDPNAVIEDPARYLGGPLRYTSPSGDFDEFASHLLTLAERLASAGGGADDPPNGSPDCDAPLLSVEAYAYPERGAPDRRHIQGHPAVTHRLEFNLDCNADTTELRIGLGGAPGMLEFDEISLEYGGIGSAGRTFSHLELKSMLRVRSNGAAFHTGTAYRLFIATHPVLLTFCDWKDEEGRPPRKLRLKFSYNNRGLEGNFLHLQVLNGITNLRNTIETLRGEQESSKKKWEYLLEKVTYNIGSKIDFSIEGNGALFTRTGWSHAGPWGTWTVGGEAVLRLHLARMPRSDLRMIACVRAFVPPGGAERQVNVRVNGKTVAEWKFKDGAFLTLRDEIGLASLHEGTCEIVIKTANPISPRQAGVSNDPRLLGLGFKSIELQEHESSV